MKIIPQKYALATRVSTAVILVLIIKHIVHLLGLESLSVNSLFGAIISSNVFLIGFLISGVLVDYKEAEKLPGELATSLEALTDDISVICIESKVKIASQAYDHVIELADDLLNWFHKKVRSNEILDDIDMLNIFFMKLELYTKPNYIVRMKQEQNNIRRIVKRIQTIRETSFNPSGYAVAEIITFVLIVGMIFTEITPYYEGLFLMGFVTFILIYMILLIKDFDNPFGYYDNATIAEDVSLKHLEDIKARLTRKRSLK